MVLKVKYVGIEDLWKLDLAVIKKSINVASLFKECLFDIDELHEITKNELNYKKEAQNHKTFYNSWKDSNKIIVPEIYSEMCTNQVICSQYLEFTPLCDYVKTINQQEINRLAYDLVEFFVLNMFDHKLTYGDMHWGNIFVKDGKLAIIDYGMISKLSGDDFYFYEEMLLAAKMKQKDKITKLMKSKYPNYSQKNIDIIYKGTLVLYKPYIKKFKYTSEYIEEIKSILSPEVELPKGVMLVVRNQILLSIILTHMNAEIDVSGLIKKLI